MSKQLGPRGLKVVSISIDDVADMPKLATWSKQEKANFPIVHDATGAASKALQMEQGVPYNVVLDRTGKVVGINHGDVVALKKLVAKAAGSPARKRAAR